LLSKKRKSSIIEAKPGLLFRAPEKTEVGRVRNPGLLFRALEKADVGSGHGGYLKASDACERASKSAYRGD